LSIWFLLWFVLAIIILGATVWSTIILMQQKKAWKAYAAKKGLVFTANKFFESPTLEGIIDGYNVSFFTALQQKEDSRKNRQISVMQINANCSFVDGIGAGTKEMLPFLQSLEAITPHDMKVRKWDKAHHIQSQNKSIIDAYLSEERVAILSGILKMPNADVLILLDKNEGVFRFETSNPFQDEKKIEVLVDKLIARIEKLKPSDEEVKTLSSMVKKTEDRLEIKKNSE
jgi:hypothetical protein